MGETEEDGAKPLRQPKKDGSQKPIRQAENEIPVFALFAILANMDPRTMSELIAKKKTNERGKLFRNYIFKCSIRATHTCAKPTIPRPRGLERDKIHVNWFATLYSESIHD